MNESPVLPSRLLRATAFVACWLWRSLLGVALLLVAVWGLLHGWIVPRISDYKPTLEHYATQALGLPVRMGNIRSKTVGLVPSFELDDVALLDAQGHVALLLPRVVVALSPRSVLRLGLEQLYIDHPEVAVRRDKDGHVFVAGLDVGGADRHDTRAQKWFFAQTEFVIHQGQIHWTDELLATPGGLLTPPPVTLTAVNLLVRNTARRHALHLDATAPPEWGGSHFNLNARFRQPLLGRSTGDWRDWTGQVFADVAHIDVARLRPHVQSYLQPYLSVVKPGADITRGQGSVRLWADVTRGQLMGATADVALNEVSTPLATLQAVTGRLEGHVTGADKSRSKSSSKSNNQPQGVAVSVQGLAFQLRVPAYGASGTVERLDAHWSGDPSKPGLGKWDAQGRVTGLQAAPGEVSKSPVALTASAPDAPKYIAPKPGRPGISGATVDFDVTPHSGKATVAVQHGTATFPGLLEDPVVALDALTTDVTWRQDGEKWTVATPNLRFANADGMGEAQARWHTGTGRSRFPGVLDLTGHLTRANLAQTHRYLPLVLSPKVRDYVRTAVVQGISDDVQFRVKGDILDIPFRDTRLGEFKVAAKVQDGVFVYVPTLGPVQAIWPALTHVNGDLVFERVGVGFQLRSARVEGLPGLLVTKADAQIPDLAQAVVQLTGEGRGPLAEGLALVERTPVGAWTRHALAQASANGTADYTLRLSLPLKELTKARVQGTVQLAGNDFALNPGLPPLSRARGMVTYSESGFAVQALQAGFLGGEVRLDGGMTEATANPPGTLQLRAQGSASAEGLRQAHELGWLAKAAQYASGSASYTATVALRQGRPELTVQSNLQGVALALPPPFNKAAEAVWPLRYENTLLNASLLPGPDGVVRLQDQLRLEVDNTIALHYVRDLSASEPKVLRGAIAIGVPVEEAHPVADAGVAAHIALGDVDLDAWAAVVNAMSASESIAENDRGISAFPAFQAYLPTVVALRAHAFSLGGHSLHQVVMGASRQGLNWQANADAQELSGYLEYGQPFGANSGRVYARLARLTIAPSAATQVEALLKAQPTSIPALDIVVDDFDLRGKKLGRVEVEAINTRATESRDMREWRLNKFNITMPEATFAATGQWATDADSAVLSSAARHTAMNYTLDIRNAGDLLARFGMPDVVRGGKGQLAGQVAWLGSPLALDYPSLDGQFHVNVESGQFLKADPGMAKLLGVLSLQSLPRRLLLDFRDVFSQGFGFDVLRGDVQIDKGIASTQNLQMKGVNAAVLMEGHADIARETQDMKVLVVPEIDTGAASLVASVVNPLVGITSFLTQLLLRGPFAEAATQEFHVDGSWAEPRVRKVEHKTAPAPVPSR